MCVTLGVEAMLIGRGLLVLSSVIMISACGGSAGEPGACLPLNTVQAPGAYFFHIGLPEACVKSDYARPRRRYHPRTHEDDDDD